MAIGPATRPIDLPSKGCRQCRLVFQIRSQSFADLLRNCAAVGGANIDATAHDETLLRGTSNNSRPQTQPLEWRSRPPPLAIFRERLFLNSGS